MRMQAFIFCGRGHNLSPFTNPTRDGSLNAYGNGPNDDSDEASDGGDGTAGTGVNISLDPMEPHLPKALLPIAGKPMIEYVIDWCDQADLTEINIVAPADELSLIKSGLHSFLQMRDQQFETIAEHLSSHAHHLKKPRKIKFITSKSSLTAELLQKELLPLIHGDFILLPCDFITDIPPQILFSQFLNRDPENLALSVFFKYPADSLAASDKNAPNYYIVYSENRHTEKSPILLDAYSKKEVTNAKSLKVRTRMLWKYPNATVSKKLINSFIYLCSYDVKILLSKPDQNVEVSSATLASDGSSSSITNITSDTDTSLLLSDDSPRPTTKSSVSRPNSMTITKSTGITRVLAKNGSSTSNINNNQSYRGNSFTTNATNMASGTNATATNETTPRSRTKSKSSHKILNDPTAIYPAIFNKPNKLIKDRINTRAPLAKLFRDLSRRSWRHSTDRETIAMYILPEQSTFIRTNTLVSYTDANRFILKIKANSSALTTTVAASATIGADAVVDATCQLAEKSSVKLSAIDALCRIGKKCRVSGSVLMSGVVVEDECVLENVIVGPNAKIGSKSKLSNCYVEGGIVIPSKSVLKNETLISEAAAAAAAANANGSNGMGGSASGAFKEGNGSSEEESEEDGEDMGYGNGSSDDGDAYGTGIDDYEYAIEDDYDDDDADDIFER